MAKAKRVAGRAKASMPVKGATAVMLKKSSRKDKQAMKRATLLEKLKASRKPVRNPLLSLPTLVTTLHEKSFDEKVATKVHGLRVGKGGLRKTTRTRVINAETSQLKSVLAHPTFKLNPIDAIRQHILDQQRMNAQ